MRLRPGIGIADALRALDECVNQLNYATQVTVRESTGRAFLYEQAVSNVERHLRGAFEDVPLGRLRSERFWAIAALRATRLVEMVNDERDHQIRWLERHKDLLTNLRDRFDGSDQIAILDTNVLLHFCTFTDVNWPDLLEARQVLLVVPLRVVDELDALKFARGDWRQGRARKIIRLLEDSLVRGEARVGVRAEVVAPAELDPDSSAQLAADPDLEIIEIAEGIGAYAPSGRTKLVTADLGMRIRARPRSVAVFNMPDHLRLKGERSGSADVDNP